MGNTQYRDNNRELVMKLVQIHRDGVVAEEACADLGLEFTNPDAVCREIARKVVQGSMERAVQYLAEQRLDRPAAESRIPSHEAARRREEAAANKTTYDEESAGEVIDGLRTELAEAQTCIVELSGQLDGALATINELQNAPPVVPEEITPRFLSGVLIKAPSELLDEIPGVGESTIIDMKAWAQSVE